MVGASVGSGAAIESDGPMKLTGNLGAGPPMPTAGAPVIGCEVLQVVWRAV